MTKTIVKYPRNRVLASRYQVGQRVTYDTNPRGVTSREKSGVIVKVSRGIATHGYSDPGYIYKIQDDNGNMNTVDEFAILGSTSVFSERYNLVRQCYKDVIEDLSDALLEERGPQTSEIKRDYLSIAAEDWDDLSLDEVEVEFNQIYDEIEKSDY